MQAETESFLQYLITEKRYSPHTIAAYHNDLQQFLDYLSESEPQTWGEVSQASVLAYMEHLGRYRYSAATMARKLAAVKSFFHFLLLEGHIEDDPTATIDSPRVEKRLPHILSMEEIDRLLSLPAGAQDPKGLRDWALLELLYGTGLRVSEIAALKLGDVDLSERKLYCRRAPDRERVLPLSARVCEALTAYIAKGRSQLLLKPEQTVLFVNHRGRPLTRQGLWLIVKEYADAAQMGVQVTPHTLRHTFAAHRLQEGLKLQEVQALLGHAALSTTQIYVELAGQPQDGGGIGDVAAAGMGPTGNP